MEIKKEYYEKHYNNIHYKGALGLFTNFYHRMLENSFNENLLFECCLEIGGGKGEHLKFIKHNFNKYYLTDLSIKKTKRTINAKKQTIIYQKQNAENLTFKTNSFDRVISSCVLHHVSDVEKVLQELRRTAKSNGIISLYLPCDPGMIYRWVRHFTSHRRQSKIINISMYETKRLWANEHRNHFPAIKALINSVFQQDDIKFKNFPNFGSWNFNLFTIVTIIIRK